MDYFKVDYPEPHLERTRRLLKAHPEVKGLFGNTPSTFFFIAGVVGLQVALAVALRHQPWWVLLGAAFAVGAFCNHALWTLIHECTHNLVFVSSRNNQLAQILANLPIVVPSAISFRRYHLFHHRFQGDPEYDADLASPLEAKLAGNRWWGKALWLLFFAVAQALRVGGLKKIPFVDRWWALNLIVQALFISALVYFAGVASLAYLLLSTLFSVGLHPVGARWIQEHYLVHEDDPAQETSSYYGPMNVLAFNVGFHNEHHDLMRVPWSRLPEVRKLAPEFYDSLRAHRSWTALLFRFLFDPRISLYSRAVRVNRRVGESADKPSVPKVEAEALADPSAKAA